MLRSFIVISVVAALLYIFSDRFLVRKDLIFHPERYHGHDHRDGMFFEGWYYNMVVKNQSKTIAVIPGVLINDEHRHAFIMIAYENISHYYRFPYEGFQSSMFNEEFHVKLERHDNQNRTQINRFSADRLIVDLYPIEGDDADQRVRMNLSISTNIRPDDLSILLPGTMGPFSWFSFMQCYHHVLSLRHTIVGTVQIGDDDQTIDYQGIGYIEKDWGQMFPSSWIWGQANQWVTTSESPASLFFSFANIPSGFGIEAPGFLIIFEHNHQFYRFNSYLLSSVKQLNVEIDQEKKTMSFMVDDLLGEYRLEVKAYFNDLHGGALLYGPRHGRMEKFVREMLDPNVYMDVRLIKTTSSTPQQILFEGRAHNVALEINGDIKWLIEEFRKMYAGPITYVLVVIRWIMLNYLSVTVLIGFPLALYIFREVRSPFLVVKH